VQGRGEADLSGEARVNDQDWFKKFRRHKGGGCTVLLGSLAAGLLLALAALL